MNSPAIERVLFTEEEIRRRIRQVAGEISAHYSGRELKLVGVLKGSVFFLTALVAKENVNCETKHGDHAWPKNQSVLWAHIL